MRLKDRIILAVAPPLAYLIIHLLYRLNRIEFVGEEHPRALWQENRQSIIAFWHDQLIMMALGYRGKQVNILISASKDGDLSKRLWSFFGHKAVRGSSSRGGSAAFRELVALAKEPADLVITPDGPRGPRHVLKEGVVQLARITGRPVLPMAFACSRGRRLATWDRMLMPYPFGRGVYSFGEPVYFDRKEGVESFKERLTEAMESNERQARAHLEASGVSAV